MFTTFLVAPLYNAFVLAIGVMPGGSVGFAIIALTLVVRAVFYPLFNSSIRTQMALSVVQPQLAEINTRYKSDPLERSRRTAALFTEHKIRPFSMIVSTVLQIAIFIGLSVVFFKLAPPQIHTDLLYSFVSAPAVVSERFLWIFDLTAVHSIFWTVFVVVLQYYAMKLTLARTAAAAASTTPEQKKMQEMQRMMMLYMLPAVMAFAAYSFPIAVSVYVAATSMVSIAQELYLKRKPL